MTQPRLLRRDTVHAAVVYSVLLSIAFLTLVIISLMMGDFTAVSAVGSVVVALVSALMLGGLQIRVFTDYKSQHKYLCADGIFYICLTVLIAITSVLYLIFHREGGVDLRIFIAVFMMAFAAWKLLVGVFGILRHRFNAFAEILLAAAWIASGVSLLLMANLQTEQEVLLMCWANYALVLLTVGYMLYSYVFREPTYLLTERAIEIYEKEQAALAANRMRIAARFGEVAVRPENEGATPGMQSQPAANGNGAYAPSPAEQPLTVEQKLLKIKDLFDKGLITEEEYAAKRKELLEREF